VDINRLTGELISAVNALTAAVTSQQREAQALRSRLEEMRSALG
jgi:type VI protein secretion system component VasK